MRLAGQKIQLTYFFQCLGYLLNTKRIIILHKLKNFVNCLLPYTFNVYQILPLNIRVLIAKLDNVLSGFRADTVNRFKASENRWDTVDFSECPVVTGMKQIRWQHVYPVPTGLLDEFTAPDFSFIVGRTLSKFLGVKFSRKVNFKVLLPKADMSVADRMGNVVVVDELIANVVVGWTLHEDIVNILQPNIFDLNDGVKFGGTANRPPFVARTLNTVVVLLVA